MKPAILQTYRKDGRAHVTPVWFREHEGAVEAVIAEGDLELTHLRRDPRCTFVAFEEAGRRFAERRRAGRTRAADRRTTPLGSLRNPRLSAFSAATDMRWRGPNRPAVSSARSAKSATRKAERSGAGRSSD